MMNSSGECRAVFLDRDGTINRDVRHCKRVEDFHILPGAAEAIRALEMADFKVVVITNQSVIARGWLTEDGLATIHTHMLTSLAREGAHVDAIFYCPHGPDDGCACRKPKPGLILAAMLDMNIDPDRSYMIGDAESDVLAGAAAGVKTVFISSESKPPQGSQPDHVAPDLLEAVKWVLDHSPGTQKAA